MTTKNKSTSNDYYSFRCKDTLKQAVIKKASKLELTKSDIAQILLTRWVAGEITITKSDTQRIR